MNKSLNEQGFILIEEVATTLNEIVIADGTINIDDKRIWDKILHRWSNTDWLLVIIAFEALEKKHPEYFDAGHKAIFPEIKNIILTHHRTHFRVMDKREIGLDFKTKAWRGLMSIREIWNNVFNINLPTEKRTRTFRKTTIWD